ncbi:MAG: hypothetical protein DME19_15725, partial [Verrucomicrobia bacterium]
MVPAHRIVALTALFTRRQAALAVWFVFAAILAGNFSAGAQSASTVFSFEGPGRTVMEAPTNIFIGVLRSGGTNTVTTNAVSYSTSNGTATAGLDYIAQSGTLTFGPGEWFKTIVIPILRDSLIEPDETVLVTLSNPTGGAVLSPTNQIVLTIMDNTSVLEFSAPNFTVNESDGSATIGVTRTGGWFDSVSVQYATSDGTATAGLDYTSQSGTLNLDFRFGETVTSYFSIPIANDSLVEPNETVNLILSNPSPGAALGNQKTATLTILGQDSVVEFSAPNYEVNEFGGSVIITVIRSVAGMNSGSVNFMTSDGTAVAGLDYWPQSGSLYFGPGQTTQTFAVPVLEHNFNAGSETVNLTLTGASGGIGVGAERTAVLNILNAPAAVEFAAAEFNASENAGTAAVTLRRRGDSSLAFTVDYATTTNGSAVAGLDYTAQSGTVNFAAGETNKTINFPILDDPAVDGDKSVELALVNPTGGAVLAAQKTISLRIHDNEKPVVGGCSNCHSLEFGAPGYWIMENGGTLMVTVERAGESSGTITVDYATSNNGSAVAGLDYTAQSGTVNFAAGETNKTINFPILDDPAVDGDKSVELALVNPTGGAVLAAQKTISLRIHDNEKPVVGGCSNCHSLEFGAPGYWIMENGGTLMVTVERAGESSGTITVDYATSNLTATAGLDYTAQSGTLTFGPQETVKTITIPILDDGLVEGDETFQVTLSNPTSGVILGAPSTAVVTIQDNERPVVLDGTFSSVSVAVDQSGNPGSILSFSAQTNGKLLIGGDFNLVNGAVHNRIARFNADGSLDENFNVRVGQNGETVNSITVQTDGKILIGGWFASVNGLGHTNLARLSLDGSLDAGFNPAVQNGLIFSTVVQPDGKLVIGGDFTIVNGVNRNRIARLNADGTLDATFNPGRGADYWVRSVAIQPDGKLVIGGLFTKFNNTSRSYLARLNSNGSLDTSFDPGPDTNGHVNSVVIQSDGKVLVGGYYQTPSGSPRNCITRRNADGSLDASFIVGSGANGEVLSVLVEGDGKVVIAGSFSQVDNVPRNHIARLNEDGSLDPTSNPGSGFDSITALLAQAGGKVLVNGTFTDVNGIAHSEVVRLFAGSANLSAFDFVSAPVVSEAGGVATITVERYGDTTNPMSVDYLTGDDTAAAGLDYTARSGILNFGPLESTKTISIPILDDTLVESDEKFYVLLRNPSSGSVLAEASAQVTILDDERPGSLNLGFVPSAAVSFSDYFASSPSGSIIAQPDGHVIVVSPNLCSITRLNADGSLDPTLLLTIRGCVECAAQQTDGKILLGGSFTSVNGVSRTNLARLNSDGSLDATYNPGSGPNGDVVGIIAQADGKTVVTGNFSKVNGDSRNQLARINANGSLDDTFNPSPNFNFCCNNSLAAQPDGKVIIYGDGINADGNAGVIRLNQDGSQDAAFKAASVGGLNSIVVQPDGKVLIQGRFVTVSGVSRPGIARLNTDGSVDGSFDVVVPIRIGSWGSIFSTVQSMAVQPDGKVIVGGDFPEVNGVNRRGIARLNADGSIDTSFDPGTGTADDAGTFGPPGGIGPVKAIGLAPDGDVLIGGLFTSVNGVPRAGFARLNGDRHIPSGSIDFASASFLVGEDAGTATVTVRRIGNTSGAITVNYSTSNGSGTAATDYLAQTGTLNFASGETTKTVTIPILSEGLVEDDETVNLTLSNPSGGATLGVQTTATLRILDSERPGSLDFSFDPNLEVSGAINAVVVQANGQVVIGGTFMSVNGVSLAGIARLNPDGSPDPTFNPGMNWFDPLSGVYPDVSSMAVRRDGKLLIASQNFGLARLNAIGDIEATFNPGFIPNPLAVQNDGKILAGDGSGINRLGADGLVEANFSVPIPTGYDSLTALSAQSDGKILAAVVGGGVAMLARLNADGSFDTGFPLAVANGTITALAAQSDGKIVIAGDFNNANGTGRNGVARLNEDGSLDDTFDTGGGISGVIAPRGGRSVAAAAIQEDGQIIIVGRFTSVNGIRRNGIARLNGNPPLRFVPTRPLVNGAFRLTLATQPGNTYVLQSS